MNTVATAPSNTIAGVPWKKLSQSQQNRCRRAIVEHNKALIDARGYTLSIQEVEAKYNNLQQGVKLNTLNDEDNQLAVRCHIV